MNESEFTIENHLKALRKEHKLSQESLADALGISRQSIISLEQGRSMPSVPLVISLCRFFDTAFEEFFELENELIGSSDNEIKNNEIKIKVINDPEAGSRKEHTMHELEPWRPFREAVSLRDAMDRLFEDSFITPAKMGGMPRVDVQDKKGLVIVKAELPGIAQEDINVEILDNVMTISGEKKEEVEKSPAGEGQDKGYYYKESHTGRFSRSFTLPSEVMAENATAEMKDGILTITVQKIEPKKAQKVQIKGKK